MQYENFFDGFKVTNTILFASLKSISSGTSGSPQPGDDKTITCPSASYEATGKNAPNALDVFNMENPIFNGLLTLDSMWGVSDRAVGNPKYHHVKR